VKAGPYCASLLTASTLPAPGGASVLQAQHIKRQAEMLAIRNTEVQRACEELLDLVASWPRENAGQLRASAEAANLFRDYCARSMYQVG